MTDESKEVDSKQGDRDVAPIPSRGPVSVRAVRHGQSLANVAFARAEASGVLDAGIEKPDQEVPLSELGIAQSKRLGRRLATDSDALPELVYVSPFLRARQTVDLALAELGPLGRQIPVQVDERLGDKRTGELELLTAAAIAARFPAEFEKLTALGPLAYRPLVVSRCGTSRSGYGTSGTTCNPRPDRCAW